MTLTDQTATTVWEEYRHNFSRHLLGVSHYLQSRLMDTLQGECGHRDLRLSFAPYITALAERTMRPSELAEQLSISRQACNQIIKHIEAAGYVKHRADPSDGRAVHLTLTHQGKKLRADGIDVANHLDQEFEALVGKVNYDKTSRATAKLFAHITGTRDNLRKEHAVYQGIGGSLPTLAHHTLQRLMELTRERGHPGLKLSYGQVLTLIGPAGGRIHEIAAIQGVSKQAISNIALELEGLGYLARHNDPADARQLVLRFTERGEQLIEDSVDGVADLEDEFTAAIGKTALNGMKKNLQRIYSGLELEQEIFGQHYSSDISALARKLQEQLGQHSSQALARLLLTPTVTTR